MSDKQNEVDLLKSIGVYGNQLYREGLPKGMLLEDPSVAHMVLKFDTYFEMWDQNLIKRFVRILGVKRCSDGTIPPTSVLYINKYDEHNMLKTDEAMYKELMQKLRVHNLYDIFIKKFIRPSLNKTKAIIYSDKAKVTSAMAAKAVLRGNPIAYARFSIAGEAQADRIINYNNWYYREFLVQSGGEFFSDNYISGEQRTGKSTLGTNIMKLGVEMNDWTYTNFPVKNSDAVHVYHIRKLSDLFSSKNVPSVWDHGIWLRDNLRVMPEFSSSINLITDEMGKKTAESSRTTTTEGRLGAILQQYGRKIHVARTQIGVNRPDDQLENLMTCIMTTFKEKGNFYFNAQRYDGEEKITEKILAVPAEDLPFEFYDVNFDATLPLEYDFNLVTMFKAIEERTGKEIYELTFEELKHESSEWLEANLGEEERKIRLIGISVCPNCMEKKPYNSSLDKTVKCSNKECLTIFRVDPITQENFMELPEDEYHKGEPKQKLIGISVCPYCGEQKIYNGSKEGFEQCIKAKKPYQVIPEKKNWIPYSEDFEEKQKDEMEKKKDRRSVTSKETIKKAREEKKKKAAKKTN